MKVKFVFLILLVTSNAQANLSAFDFLNFHCTRLDGPFLSEIHFYHNLKTELTGELDSYSVAGTCKNFVSGEMLLSPEYNNGAISGTTEAPGTFAETFVLLREGINNAGTWYFNSNIGGKSNLQGDFSCELNP